MKVASHNATKTEQHGSLTSLGDVTIGSESIAKLFSIITERMYEDPIRALTRELLTNMVDAHMQRRATDGHLPPEGIVSLPSSMRSSVKFYDHGPGMSHQEISQYVCHILQSSKDQSNEFHGGWGLGMKSPFSYTKQWSLTSRQGGRQTTYATFMQDTGIPAVSQLGSPAPTDEPDGLTIEVPVKQDDFDSFRHWIEWYLYYLPEGFVTIPGQESLRPEYDPHWQGSVTIDGFDWQWRVRTVDRLSAPNSKYKHRMTGPGYQAERVRVVLGAVPYIEVPGVSDHLLRTVPLDIYAPIGSLSVTPDRDRLSANDDQVARIDSVLNQIHADLTSAFIKSLEEKRPFTSLSLAERNEAYVHIQRQAFKQRGSHQIQHQGMEFDVFSSAGAYSLPATQLVKALHDHALPSEEDAVITLRKRDYDAPSQVTTISLGANYTIPIDDTLKAVYYDDVGRGSIGRFQDIHIMRNPYTREDRKTYYLIHVQDAEFADFDRDQVALALGIPTDMLRPISELDPPETRSAASSISVTKQAPDDLGGELHNHPLVFQLYEPNYSYDLRNRDWPWRQDPTQDTHYYITTNSGAIDRKGWPSTTGARSAADWSTLRRMPNEIWDWEDQPVTFLPGTVSREIRQLNNWHPFFDKFEDSVRAYIHAHYPDLDLGKVYLRNQSNHADRIDKVRSRLRQAEQVAQLTDTTLPAGIRRQLKFFSNVYHLLALVPSGPFWFYPTMPSILGLPDITKQSRALQARARRVERRYPMLQQVDHLPTKPISTPRNKEAISHVLKAATRRAPQSTLS